MSNEKFVDPLDALMARIGNAETESETEKVIDIPLEENVEESISETPAFDYGDNDIEAEIEAEEKREAEERRMRADEYHETLEANKPHAMPPRSLDPKDMSDSVDFQTNNVAIVTTMINKVVAKYNLTSGGIPEKIKMMTMGDLMELYQRDGDVITSDFEDVILERWDMGDNVSAKTYIKMRENGELESSTESNNEVDETETKETVKDEPVQININVAPDTPVTVNVDESFAAEIKKTQVIDVVVKEVTTEELMASTVITNSQIDGIIQPYDSGLSDVPVALPASGYRAIVRPMNWFEVMAMIAPESGNIIDREIKTFSTIYEHIKWTSIGKFESFEDFMNKTKYADRELLVWAILVGTADEHETVQLQCGNPKCKHIHDYTYNPRSIVKIDEKRIPAYYKSINDVSPGEEAVKLYDSIASKKKRYVLPSTKTIFEFSYPSANEFVNNRYGRLHDIYTKLYPEGDFDKDISAIFDNISNNMHTQFALLAMCAIMISSASIMKDGKEYRYTNWEDIELIVTKHLNFTDSNVLIQLLTEVNTFNSPISFELPGYVCSQCGHNNDDMVISNIANSLLFLLSRRLENTQINLIDLEQNF